MLFGKKQTENERDLSQTTGGGFERPKERGFFKSQVDKAKTKINDRIEFERQVSTVRNEAKKKERLRLAKKQGKQKARGGFNLGLGQGLTRAKSGQAPKSNMERMLYGGGGGGSSYNNDFGSGLRKELNVKKKNKKRQIIINI